MAILDVANVSKAFGGLRAVSDVTFSVPEGSIFAVIGPNGAGKTTLFNLIAGAHQPTSGTIMFAGERIDGLSSDRICRKGVGRTFQIVRPFHGLTVEDNVIVGALLRRPGLPSATRHARDVLARLDLYDKREQMASSLTLPDRKRLEVARALATEPKLLLLDEVMATGDAAFAEKSRARVLELMDRARAIVFVTHDLEAAEKFCNRAIEIEKGEIIAAGTPAQVIAGYKKRNSITGPSSLGKRGPRTAI